MARSGPSARKGALAAAGAAFLLCAGALPAGAAEAGAPLAVSVGPVRRGDSRVPWRVINRGETPVERVSLDAFSGVDFDPDAPRRFFECAWLPPGAETGGVFQADLPSDGPRLFAFRATGLDLDGYDVRAWSCTRLWPAASVPPPPSFSLQARIVPSEAPGAEPSLAVEIQSLSDGELELACRVLTPSGCSVRDADAGRFSVALPPRAAVERRIALRRASAFAMRGTVRVAAEIAPGSPSGARGCECVAAPVAFSRDASGFPSPARRTPPYAAAVVFAVALAASLLLRRRRGAAGPGRDWIGMGVAAALSLWLAHVLHVELAFGAGTPVAGDLAAHNVLVSRMAETGRVFGWESAWWCGFPAFRYYFPLPYVVAALASRVIGHNAAMALAVGLPLVALPFCAWAGGRLARLPRPTPALLAAAALPVVLDNTHTMWGGNAYSALSGMIANAWSFALLPVVLGLAVRDAARRRFSVVSALSFAALALCHFFAALVAAAALLAFVAALLARRRRAAAAALAAEGAAAGALCAFWLLPLAATRGWSVDFGEQWHVDFLAQAPPALHPAAVAALALVFALSFAAAPRRRGPDAVAGGGRALVDAGFVTAAMLAVSIALFAWGRVLSEVFVNCRLWPFAVFAALALCAMGAGRAAAAFRLETPAALALAVLSTSYAWRERPPEAAGDGAPPPRWARECLAGPWAQSVFSGFEALPDADALRQIVAAVAGRPGVVAWDYHEGNEALGSVRVFEALPYLAPGTRTLAGGLVNGALGAIAAHSVQGQMSDNTLGWPLFVRPLPTDPARGLRRLEALGVRTFVARSARVQDAVEADGLWHLIASIGPWRVYDAGLGDPGLARVLPPGVVPDELPAPRALRRPQRAVADWWNRGDAPPASREGWIRDAVLDPSSGSIGIPVPSDAREEDWIAVAVTADPGWEASGAAAIGVLPWGQMAVRPAPGSRRVVLHRRPLSSARVGGFVSLLVAAALTAAALAATIRRGTA